jgi:hypothetical protein
VSELRSVVESLRAEVLSDLPDARIEEDFCELHAAVEQLELERLRRLAEIDGRRVFERDGYLSCASWLVGRLKVAWGAARDQVRMARGLKQMPQTRASLEAAELSLSAARVLVMAQHGEPEAFVEAEPLLVEAARIHSVTDLNRAVAFWTQRVQSERSGGADPRYGRRRLHASVTLGGMVRLDGDLDPETGETVLSALGAVLDAEAHSRSEEDRRSPAQRRADALGEICRQWLDRADRPTVAGERPHLTLTVGVQELSGNGSGIAELDHAGAIGIDTALRLACDASLMRVVLSAESQPLDIGRRSPVVPSGMRRAVIVRDRHCQFPGCDRPASWCDIHHVVHWSRGGPTSMANLLLLCRRHHGLVHEHGGFSLELMDGRPVFRRADGSVLEDRAPP